MLRFPVVGVVRVSALTTTLMVAGVPDGVSPAR
jgi:hypothetical protein